MESPLTTGLVAFDLQPPGRLIYPQFRSLTAGSPVSVPVTWEDVPSGCVLVDEDYDTNGLFLSESFGRVVPEVLWNEYQAAQAKADEVAARIDEFPHRMTIERRREIEAGKGV